MEKLPLPSECPAQSPGTAVKSSVENTGSKAETHCVLKAGGQRKRQMENWACFGHSLLTNGGRALAICDKIHLKLVSRVKVEVLMLIYRLLITLH